MEVKGTQRINASQEQVFQALLNTDVLKSSIPGCEAAEFVDFPTGRQLKLTVSPTIVGLKGPYTIYVQTGEVVPPSRVVLIAEPYSSLGSIKATCVTDLTSNEDGSTLLTYNAHAELSGKIAVTPEMVLKGATKIALEQFFKSFDKQVSSVHA